MKKTKKNSFVFDESTFNFNTKVKIEKEDYEAKSYKATWSAKNWNWHDKWEITVSSLGNTKDEAVRNLQWVCEEMNEEFSEMFSRDPFHLRKDNLKEHIK